jgi:hypothetical protein
MSAFSHIDEETPDVLEPVADGQRCGVAGADRELGDVEGTSPAFVVGLD